MESSEHPPYILLYDYEKPASYSTKISDDKNFLYQALKGYGLHHVRINALDHKFRTFQSRLSNIHVPIIWATKYEFIKYRFELQVNLDIQCAFVLMHDPKSELGTRYDEAYWISQRLEICGSVLPFIESPIFLASLYSAEQPRTWQTLLWEHCRQLPIAKYQYHITDIERVADEFSAFIEDLK